MRAPQLNETLSRLVDSRKSDTLNLEGTGDWMSTEPFVSQFRELSSDEKIRLVQELWDEIAEEVSRRPLSESQRRLLDERLADEEQNPDDVEPWAKAKADILRDL